MNAQPWGHHEAPSCASPSFSSQGVQIPRRCNPELACPLSRRAVCFRGRCRTSGCGGRSGGGGSGSRMKLRAPGGREQLTVKEKGDSACGSIEAGPPLGSRKAAPASCEPRAGPSPSGPLPSGPLPPPLCIPSFFPLFLSSPNLHSLPQLWLENRQRPTLARCVRACMCVHVFIVLCVLCAFVHRPACVYCACAHVHVPLCSCACVCACVYRAVSCAFVHTHVRVYCMCAHVHVMCTCACVCVPVHAACRRRGGGEARQGI